VPGTFDDDFAAEVRKSCQVAVEEESCSHDPHPILDREFTYGEIKTTLLNLKSGKAAGPDRIPNEMLKYGGDGLANALRKLFNHIWLSEKWPQQWCHGNVVLLHKGGPKEQLDNYRGITLLSTISKVFENVINRRLYAWAEGEHKLRDEQGGFRPDRRCVDQMFLLHEVVAMRRESNLATFCAFIDVKKAYDTVWRDGLWRSLRDMDLQGKMHRMLVAMFKSMQRAVMVEGELSQPYSVEIGVAQGAVTSPFLYASFINHLLEAIGESECGVSIAGTHIACLAYADDIVLIAPTAEKLQALLDLLAKHAHKWRFRFNANKSNVMVFGTKRQIAEADAEHFQLGPDAIDVVRDYKYLGCEASALLGRASAVVDRLVQVAKLKGSNLSGPGGCRFGGVHAVKSMSLWEAYVRPVLEYGAEVWTPNSLQAKKLDSVLCDFARHALGADRRTGNDVLLSELGLVSLAARRDELRLRFFRHLCLADPERALSKVFRQRCDEVDQGKAKRSLCMQYRSLLLKYGFKEVWDLRSVESEDWEGWFSKARKAITKREIAERRERLAGRDSMIHYLSIKPSGSLSRSSYLFGHGLGVWLKLRLRANNLPLLSVLARTSKPQMDDECARCILCGLEREDVAHFLLRCPALRGEKMGLIQQLQKGDSTAPAATVLLGEDDQAQLKLLLGSREEPVRKRKRKKQSRGSGRSARRRRDGSESEDDESGDEEEQSSIAGDGVDDTTLREMETITLGYFVQIWRRRAELLGGVPTLDHSGLKMVMGQLRSDGRCSSFARRVPVA
jgi:hypothetical protein